jgi:BASS family bile acid:Na+ symporter
LLDGRLGWITKREATQSIACVLSLCASGDLSSCAARAQSYLGSGNTGDRRASRKSVEGLCRSFIEKIGKELRRRYSSGLEAPMAALIILAARISLAVAVFALGLTASANDLTYMFRRPGKLVPALLSMIVIMPAIAVWLVLSFKLIPEVKIALTALAVSPTPAMLPRKVLKAGGSTGYALGLLVATSLLAIVWVPLSQEIFQRIFDIPLEMRPLSVAGLVLTSVLGPLIVGIGVRAVMPELARRIAAPCAIAGTVVLTLAILPVLFVMLRRSLSLLGNGTLAAILAFALIGLAAGHFLGRPSTEDRKVLALYTISRHPGIAIAIAQTNFPEQTLAIPAIVLAVIVSAIVSIPYLNWMKPHHGSAAPAE